MSANGQETIRTHGRTVPAAGRMRITFGSAREGARPQRRVLVRIGPVILRPVDDGDDDHTWLGLYDGRGQLVAKSYETGAGWVVLERWVYDDMRIEAAT